MLSELDPVACLKRLNALVSPHPYDLEPVQPTVDSASLLTQFKFVVGMDVIAGLDSRSDLLAMNPYEFEHLVRQIFEEMAMQAWNTQAITTSWVTKDGHVFAARHGRIEIMECEQVKYLCKEHLGLDVLISLPKPPPR